jgi:isopentenyl phosphate kinase
MSINEVMPRVIKAAGLKVSRKVHILGHTFCSHLATRGYSGAAEPEEPSTEVAARVNAELEAFIDHLQLHLEPLVFAEVMRLTAQRAVGEPQPNPGH